MNKNHRSEDLNIFCNEPDSKYLSFAGYLVSLATPYLCCCGVKAAKDKNQTNGHDCSPIKLRLQK